MPEERLPPSLPPTPSTAWGRRIILHQGDAPPSPTTPQQQADVQRQLRDRLLQLIINQERTRRPSAK